MRVLLSAPNDKPWSPGRQLEVALRDVAGEARLLDFRSVDHPDDTLLALVAEWRPQVHVAWKGERYRPETLRELSARGVFNVLWHPDVPVPDWLPPLAKAADLCLAQSAGTVAALQAAGAKDPARLVEGITPACFSYETLTAEDHARYDCDVVLIGTVGHPREYYPRLEAINRLIREGVKVRWFGAVYPRRLNTLRHWFSPGVRAYGGGLVWGPAYAKACHCAKICLNLPWRAEAQGGLSSGAFMATGVGAFLLHGYRKGMEEFFDLGPEVAVFADFDEMSRKVHYYLAHAAERAAIAEAGRRRTLENHTNQCAFRRLLDLVAARGGPRSL